MSRAILALALVMVVAGCGARTYTAPTDLENACAILDERPEYLRAFRKTQSNWGVPVPVIMAMIYQESKFIGDNRPPHRYALGVIPVGRQSSAFGYSQALDGTWEEYQDQHGGRGARRDNIDHATDFMGWYMNQSRNELGLAMTDAKRQYLAYHEGRSGYRRGSYNSKAWLMRVANKVGARAVLYDIQLQSCGKI